MRNMKSHTKTLRKKLTKCKNVFSAFTDLQFRYGEILDSRKDILEIKTNIKLVGCSLGDNYSTDFYCLKDDGNYMVRECVYKSKLLKPQTIKLLDASRSFWLTKGVEDWGIVVNEEQII